jgi:GT2 family glycosyltransferase
MKKVSVITVNYNQPAVTEALLASLADVNSYSDTEVIVVDNGSRIDPVPVWQAKYPGVTFIRSDKNLGFAGGNNLALAHATGDFLFLLNNDTEVTPTLIGGLAKILELHPEVGMVSPKICYYDRPDMLQYAGFSPMNYYTARTTCIGQYETDSGQYDGSTGKTGYAHGAAMMVRREAIEKAGPMADNFFLYYEEMDWCDRIRRAGYDIWVDTQEKVYHKESVSVGVGSPLKEYFMNRNRILFIRRNATLLQRAVFWPYFIFVVAVRNVLGYIGKGQRSFIPVLFRAIWWNMTHDVDSTDTGYPVNDIA